MSDVKVKNNHLNILVTGGAGYIGSVLVPELLKTGHKVTVLDNFLYNHESLMQCCNNENFNIIYGDVRDQKILKKALEGIDYIIPLAAIVGAPKCDQDRTNAISTNKEAISLLVKLASEKQRIIIPNTNSGYGIGSKNIYCTEKTPLRPISLYGKTKMEAEKIVLSRGNGISLRLATVFGASPRMRIDLLVNDFVYRAVKDNYIVVFEGDFIRNYIHIRDVARAFIHVINNFNMMKNQAYNVGLSNANLSKIELCEEIKKQLPNLAYFKSKIGKDIDKRNYLVSNKKIEKTGFKPIYSIEDGIKELIKAFRGINKYNYGNI